MLFAQFLIEIKEQTLCPIDAMDLYMAIELLFFWLFQGRSCALICIVGPHTQQKMCPQVQKNNNNRKHGRYDAPDISSVFLCVHIHPASIYNRRCMGEMIIIDIDQWLLTIQRRAQ